MIRHVLAFQLSDRDHDAEIRERLTGLVGVVPGLVSMDVEPDLGTVESNWDMVLVSLHESAEALAAYQTHPAHVEAATFARQFMTARAVVDYELPASASASARSFAIS